jgi:hypothetical protein
MLGKNRFGVFTDISSQRTVVWPDVHALVSVLRVFGFSFWINLMDMLRVQVMEKQTKQSSLRRSEDD